MQKQSNNVIHGQNLAVLAAAVELGTEALLRSLGGDTSATTFEGEFITKEDIQAALVARINKFLG